MKFLLKLIVFVVVLSLVTSCSKNTCPTTDKKYFTRNAYKSKPLYKTKMYGKNTEYIIPKKYRKGVPNYGKLK